MSFILILDYLVASSGLELLQKEAAEPELWGCFAILYEVRSVPTSWLRSELNSGLSQFSDLYFVHPFQSYKALYRSLYLRDTNPLGAE